MKEVIKFGFVKEEILIVNMKQCFYVLLLLIICTWSAHIDYAHGVSVTIPGSSGISNRGWFR